MNSPAADQHQAEDGRRGSAAARGRKCRPRSNSGRGKCRPAPAPGRRPRPPSACRARSRWSGAPALGCRRLRLGRGVALRSSTAPAGSRLSGRLRLRRQAAAASPIGCRGDLGRRCARQGWRSLRQQVRRLGALPGCRTQLPSRDAPGTPCASLRDRIRARAGAAAGARDDHQRDDRDDAIEIDPTTIACALLVLSVCLLTAQFKRAASRRPRRQPYDR